jgi:hypothetical protein
MLAYSNLTSRDLSIPRQRALPAMRILAIGIEYALDVAIEGTEANA